MADWASLPSDIFNKIVALLHSHAEYVRMGAVCANWSSLMPRRRLQVPWLLLPYEDQDETVRGFYNLLEQKVYRLKLPEARGKSIRGSSHGWLVTTGEGPEMGLLNPFTRAQLHLPPKTAFPNVKDYCPHRLDNEYAILGPNGDGDIDYCSKSTMRDFFVQRVILSSTPAHDGYIAVAIYGATGRLAFCRRGDKQWKEVLSKNYLGCISDAIFHAGKLYAIDKHCRVYVGDLNVPSPKLIKLPVNPPKRLEGCNTYLVRCSDGIMIIVRVLNDDEDEVPWLYKTTKFSIFKMNLAQRCWFKVKSISNSALLLGFNSSFSVPQSILPKGQGNRIYFSDNLCDYHTQDINGGHDMGVFSLEDGSIKGFDGCVTDSGLVWPPPVWVMPDHSLASVLQSQEIIPFV